MSLGWEALLKTLHFELRATLGIVVEFQEVHLEDLPQQWLSTNASQPWAVIQEVCRHILSKACHIPYPPKQDP